MLDEEAKENLQLIYDTAKQIWGDDCEFANICIKNSPWSEFELPMRIYHIDVGIYYDRSALDIGIRKNGKYELLEKFTKKTVFRGMKAMKPENLLHNFKALDETLKIMDATS